MIRLSQIAVMVEFGFPNPGLRAFQSTQFARARSHALIPGEAQMTAAGHEERFLRGG